VMRYLILRRRSQCRELTETRYSAAVRREKIRRRHHRTLLRQPVQQVGFFDQVVAEAVVKDAEPTSQNCFRRRLSIASQAPCNAANRLPLGEEKTKVPLKFAFVDSDDVIPRSRVPNLIRCLPCVMDV